jgi:hypothetical protein
MNILITAGGTVEPIDNVRGISNFATGRLGGMIADNLAHAGGNNVIDEALGGPACQNALRGGPLKSGGFGASATVGKALGFEFASDGGVGAAALCRDKLLVGAIVRAVTSDSSDSDAPSGAGRTL